MTVLQTHYACQTREASVAGLGELSPTLREVIHRAEDPERFSRWQVQVRAAGYCSRPVRLSGWVRVVDRDTGEVATVFDTATEPDQTLLKACGTRREAVCRSCSATYRADAWQLIAAGVRGGKGVPDTVAGHPMLFATFTAPSFGPVHSTRARDGRPHECHPPRRRPQVCPHGVRLVCRRRHDRDDEVLGEPLCADCFDYEGAVLFNALAGELWRRTTIAIHRGLAALAGVPTRALDRLVRVSYVKVAEYQRRGVVHLHAVVRLDAAHACDPERVDPPPAVFTTGLLERAVRRAAAAVRVRRPNTAEEDGQNGRWIGWGDQLDVRHITTEGPTGLSSTAVAAYIAKYATKSTETLGNIGGRLREGDLELLALRDHVHRLVDTCWGLGGQPHLGHLRLRAWAHMLGFRGHFATKSRHYSTTFTALRRARLEWTVHRHRDAAKTSWPAPDDDTTAVIGDWRFLGVGYRTSGDAWLAESAAARAREERRVGREELTTAVGSTL